MFSQPDPNNISAIDGIGSILYNMAGTPYTRERFEESKTYHMKHIALKPEDPEPYYWVGVIDWTLPTARIWKCAANGAWRTRGKPSRMTIRCLRMFATHTPRKTAR